MPAEQLGVQEKMAKVGRLLSVTGTGQLTGIVNLDNIMALIKIQIAMLKRHQLTKWQA